MRTPCSGFLFCRPTLAAHSVLQRVQAVAGVPEIDRAKARGAPRFDLTPPWQRRLRCEGSPLFSQRQLSPLSHSSLFYRALC